MPRLVAVGRQNLRRAQIGDADAVLDLFWLLFTTVQAAARSHQELVLENLLLRHQLAVLTRPTPSVGIGRAPACSGAGSPAPPAAVLGSALKCGS